MKKVFIAIGAMSLGFATYQIINGDSFIEHISLLINGIIMFWCAFIDLEKNTCENQINLKT